MSKLFTGIFACGDARYYSRVRLPDDWTDDDVASLFQDMANQFSGAKVLAVTKSIYYLDDLSQIPAGDSGPEYRAKVLLTCEDQSTFQIEIPMVEPSKGLAEDVLTNFFTQTYGMQNANGSNVTGCVGINLVRERKARGK